MVCKVKENVGSGTMKRRARTLGKVILRLKSSKESELSSSSSEIGNCHDDICAFRRKLWQGAGDGIRRK